MTDIFYSLESEVRNYSRSWPVESVRPRRHQTDSNGTEYVDFFSGAGALNYGHNHPAVRSRSSSTCSPAASCTAWT